MEKEWKQYRHNSERIKLVKMSNEMKLKYTVKKVKEVVKIIVKKFFPNSTALISITLYLNKKI